jgi:hypothetical protein
MCAKFLTASLALVCLVLPASAAEKAEGTPATIAAGITSETLLYDVFQDKEKVGQMRLKLTHTRDVTVIEESFTVPFNKRPAGVDLVMAYNDADKRPLRIKATTRVGTFKLMDGSITFGPGPVKAEILGYADKDLKPFEKPMVSDKVPALPEGIVLSYPAFLYYAPRLLPKAGEMTKVTYLIVPADWQFPNFVSLETDCVLSRSPPAADGTSEFAIKRVYAGGNAVLFATLTVEKSGKIVESRFSTVYTLRPQAEEKPVKAPPKTGPAK